MLYRLQFVLVGLISNFFLVAALFEACDLLVNLTVVKNHTFESTNYTVFDVRRRYTAGTSCRVHYIVSHGYTIRVNGFIGLDIDFRVPNCNAQGQKFMVSRNGDKSFFDADIFCGSRAVSGESIGNEMTIGYTSDQNGQGRFQIKAESVPFNKKTCNCGWGQYSVGSRLIFKKR